MPSNRKDNKNVYPNLYIDEFDNLTKRQIEFLILVRNNGGSILRKDMLWRFGLGVDSVAIALIFKGYLGKRVNKDGFVEYYLRGKALGDV